METNVSSVVLSSNDYIRMQLIVLYGGLLASVELMVVPGS